MENINIEGDVFEFHHITEFIRNESGDEDKILDACTSICFDIDDTESASRLSEAFTLASYRAHKEERMPRLAKLFLSSTTEVEGSVYGGNGYLDLVKGRFVFLVEYMASSVFLKNEAIEDLSLLGTIIGRLIDYEMPLVSEILSNENL